MSEDSVRAVRRALISVSDKTGLESLGSALAERGVALVSTGGSAAALRAAGLPVDDVADVTGFPEIMDGRIKTLHPHIHGAILGRRDVAGHVAAMERLGIAPIDLVVVNLYPFAETVRRGAGPEDCIENIDIGGPALIRAAAKNHRDVVVITEAADYEALLAELEVTGGGTRLAFRQAMAARAYARTAAYDAAVAGWFADRLEDPLPERLVLAGHRRQTLRYGENPHQTAAFYAEDATRGDPRPGVATARQVQGKALSYNNINDTDAAFELVAELAGPAIAIIKHANPCGVAEGKTLAEAFARAKACDPVSAFGGVIAANRPLDAALVEAVGDLFVEVLIAPGADDEALARLAARRNLRVLLCDGLPDPAAPGRILRQVAGGWLVQGRDAARTAAGDLQIVTRRAPDKRELADMLFAFTVAKHVKSNAIVYARDLATVGIGAGQMSRVDSARIAARKAEDAARAAGSDRPLTRGSVVASDAFFPFADGLLAAADAGATAVIQPGGSVRDAEVIAAADERGLAMAFTGVRHFRH